MILDWTDLIPTTCTGWAIVALFGLPLLGALILVWAMLGGFSA
jgi:hypothetical protein